MLSNLLLLWSVSEGLDIFLYDWLSPWAPASDQSLSITVDLSLHCLTRDVGYIDSTKQIFIWRDGPVSQRWVLYDALRRQILWQGSSCRGSGRVTKVESSRDRRHCLMTGLRGDDGAMGRWVGGDDGTVMGWVKD